VLAIVVGLILSAMYGPQADHHRAFPTRIRYSGVSMAYQLTAIFAGSLAPIIAIALYRQYDSATPVAIYVGSAASSAASRRCWRARQRAWSWRRIR
jgi:hypothetical protein